MPRRIIRSLAARAHALSDKWYVRPFSKWLLDPRLWSLQRRGITAAFGIGLAICFVPLPVHIPLAFAIAILARVNAPVLVTTVFLVNPLTVLPTYFLAYRVGSLVTGAHRHRFHFELSWDWLQYGLGPMWKPFLAGCALCALVFGLLGWGLLELLWRWRVIKKYRARRGAAPR
jgi:uncharacterized protein (DUF2062 family)